jgi:hypothetical protein
MLCSADMLARGRSRIRPAERLKRLVWLVSRARRRDPEDRAIRRGADGCLKESMDRIKRKIVLS